MVFARAAGGLVWCLWAMSGLRAFAGRRPALLVERCGLAVLGCGWRAWDVVGDLGVRDDGLGRGLAIWGVLGEFGSAGRWPAGGLE